MMLLSNLFYFLNSELFRIYCEVTSYMNHIFPSTRKFQSSLKLEKKDRCIIHDKRDQLHNISRNSANAAYSVQCNMIIVDKYYYGTWIILSGIRAQDCEIENPVP